MGRFIVAAGVNPPTTNVKVDVADMILPLQGAIMLVDPAHQVSPWASGVPTSGALLTNIAQSQAQALYPSLTSAQLQPSLVLGSTWGSDKGKIERSGKGGLHLARKQIVAGDTNTTCRLQTDTALFGSNGLGLHLDHSYFISLWARVTRAYEATAATQVHNQLGNSSFSVSEFFTRRTTGEVNFPTDSRRAGYRATGATNTGTTLGPMLQNIAITNIASPIGGTSSTILSVGNGFSAGGDFGKQGSFVFYRFYMEDLTVSGRSYAAVDAMDWAMFTSDVLTAGGRYYGDTFTDPATL